MYQLRSFLCVLSFVIYSCTLYGAASYDIEDFEPILASVVDAKDANTVSMVLQQEVVQDYLTSNPSSINKFLRSAILNDDIATFKALYKYSNVSIDQLKTVKGFYGENIIQLAAKTSFDITEFLINLHPVFVQAVDVTDEMGRNLLHMSLCNGCNNWRTTGFLLKKGANPNAVDRYRQTPVHMAAIDKDSVYLRIILNYGGDPYALDYLGNSPLYYAAVHRRSENVKLLLVDPKQINYQNKVGQAPLAAVQAGSDSETIEISKRLLDAGADKEIPLYTGQTPLQIAAMNNNWDSVELLLTAPLPAIYVQPFRLN